MMYHIDLEGRQLFEKINFREERIDLLENPLLGPLLRRRDKLMEDNVMSKRANQIAIYYLNLHKRYDLDVRLFLCYQMNRTTCTTGRFRQWTGSEQSTISS